MNSQPSPSTKNHVCSKPLKAFIAETCYYLLAYDYSDEDSLLAEILSFTTINSVRYVYFKTDP